jgi:hypothetical protein
MNIGETVIELSHTNLPVHVILKSKIEVVGDSDSPMPCLDMSSGCFELGLAHGSAYLR